MPSPIDCLLPSFQGAPFQLAPEREKELQDLITTRNISFNMDAEKQEMVFEGASLFGSLGLVNVGVRGLERIWVHAFGAMHVYKRFQASGFSEPLLLSETSEGCMVEQLLKWAMKADVEGDPTPWPDHLPQPQVNPSDEVHLLANEVFLGATGFAVLHEIGHVVREHRTIHGTTDERFRQEFEADEWAYDWVMDKWREYENNPLVFQKRTVLIAAMFAILASLDLYSPKEVERLTHPNIIDRLMRFLIKHANEALPLPTGLAWAVASTQIQLHVSQRKSLPTFQAFSEYFNAIRPLFNKSQSEKS